MAEANVGYNIKKINDLLEEIKKSYKDVGDAIEDGWDGLKKTAECEWVGPDEEVNMAQFAKHMCQLYESCKTAIQGVINNVAAMGETWRNFQLKNVISSGGNGDTGASSLKTIDKVTLEARELKLKADATKIGKTFGEDTKLGLTNGKGSVQKIEQGIDEYVKQIYNQVKALYADLESSTAFLGEQQGATINKYLQDIGAAIGKITTCVKSIKEALNTALDNYMKEATTVKQDVSQIDTNIDYAGENIQQ